MNQQEEAAKVNALTERVKGIEAKIQILIDAAKTAGEVAPELQAAIDGLETEIGNTETETNG